MWKDTVEPNKPQMKIWCMLIASWIPKATHIEHSFIHLVVSLTTGPKPLPKPALHIVRSRASSFK